MDFLTDAEIEDIDTYRKAGYTGTPPVVLEPSHTMATNYTYNSLNAVRVQQSPDKGIDKHWYDRLGRPVISQSARQQAASPKLYSYIIYDYKGRITEAGEISSDSLPVTTGGGFIEQTDMDAFIAGAGTRAQVTRSYYNSSPFSATMDTLFRPFGQENLRNRIAVMTYTETYGVDTAYDFATHYSYDVLGNVKTLMQDIKELASRNNRYKRVDYEYDLQSGKVNRVIYQKDSVDQYMYVYEYDADNRLSETTSGPNEMFMKTESVQSYYDHGPLFRTQLGEERVQGMDYAYTLQGWIKGVNGSGLNAAKDIGRDGYISGGNTNQTVARDAFGFTLNYFNGIYDGGTTLYHDGDYTPVTPATATFAAAPTGTGGPFDMNSKDLFNGNIRYTTLQLKGIDTVPIAYAYRYDQLQRLKEMNFFNASINASTYSLNNSTAASGDYHEAYSYDGNGNILTLNRRGYYSGSQAQPMDSLTYAYTSGTNRLSQLSDIINVANYSVDLDSVNNYTYDESGNLKTDAKEKISDVTWSPYDKIKNIAKSLDTVNIAYSYDASMNRVVKKYTSASDTIKTYYIRDAQGNVLAVYNIDNDSLRWSEQHLYGNARLGLIEKNILLNSSTVNVNKPGTPGLVLGIKRNERRYELTNHLGNVFSVISDVKRPNTESSNTYYDVDRIAVNDYYPFGMQMPGRKQKLDTYRYGFNGKENDNEIKGEGNQQDYGMRIYDPRVGRFLSVDPISAQYPELTPYQFASNTPIMGIDLDGLEIFYSTNGYEIGRLGTSTEVKVVCDVQSTSLVAYNIALANGLSDEHEGLRQNSLKIIDQNTQSTGLTNEELNTRAVLTLVRHAEAANEGKPLPYNYRYGNYTFEGDQHPKKMVTKWRKTSDAAGAYQFLSNTWEFLKKEYGYTDFLPETQDRAAIAAMEQQEIYGTNKKGLLNDVRTGNLESAIPKLKGTWPSLPGGTQEQMTLEQAQILFRKIITDELHGDSAIKTPQGKLDGSRQ